MNRQRHGPPIKNKSYARGLKSIISALGNQEFARIQIGVGGGEPRRDLADHVLGRFALEERAIVAEAVSRSRRP